MPKSDSSPGESTDTSEMVNAVSRRTVLAGTAATGALLLGVGTASAHGQGGQAVVHAEDYLADGSFVISRVEDCDAYANEDGSCWDVPLYYQCEGQGGRVPPGKGGTIPFPFWNFNYEGDLDEDSGHYHPEPRKLYTRDNEVKTGVHYHWPGNEKECGELVQTGFVAGHGDK